jgi:hypothetical protein
MIDLKNITLEDVNGIDIESTAQNVELYKHYYVQPAGENHYRLLSYISSKLHSGALVYDVGTLHGTSAYALAYNPHVSVVSYDIVDNGIGLRTTPPNLQFKIGDVRNDLYVLSADVILVDTMHDGQWELDFYNWLVKNDYHGITIWDDTKYHEFPGMESVFLNNVQHEIIDLTHLGHITGTTAIIL